MRWIGSRSTPSIDLGNPVEGRCSSITIIFVLILMIIVCMQKDVVVIHRRKNECSSKLSIKHFLENINWWLLYLIKLQPRMLQACLSPSLLQIRVRALSHQEYTRIFQMAINGQIWSKWTIMAVWPSGHM